MSIRLPRSLRGRGRYGGIRVKASPQDEVSVDVILAKVGKVRAEIGPVHSSVHRFHGVSCPGSSCKLLSGKILYLCDLLQLIAHRFPSIVEEVAGFGSTFERDPDTGPTVESPRVSRDTDKP
jgi:hypothetical protein